MASTEIITATGRPLAVRTVSPSDFNVSLTARGFVLRSRMVTTGGPTRDRLARTLLALPLMYPNDSTWHTIDVWTQRAGEAGERFSLGDLLIGVLAATEQALVWSHDDDFRRMAALGLITLYR